LQFNETLDQALIKLFSHATLADAFLMAKDGFAHKKLAQRQSQKLISSFANLAWSSKKNAIFALAILRELRQAAQ